MLGYLAEVKVKNIWFTRPGIITECTKSDDHDRLNKGDLVITYKSKKFVIEVKSLQSNSIKHQDGVWTGKAQVDASDRRKVKLPNGTAVETTCLLVGEFDLLAVNLFAFEEKWHYIFAKNKDLPRSTFSKYTAYQKKFLLASLVSVSWPPKPPFYDDPFPLLDEISRERK